MILADALSLYVQLRRTGGCDASSGASVLRHFARYVGADRELDTIPPHEIRAFIDGTGPLTRYWHRKHSALLGFYRFALGRRLVSNLPMTVVPPRLRQTFRPYIYTEAELARLIDAMTGTQDTGQQLEPTTFRVLLLLLYGAGLRLSEALRLTRADFDTQRKLLIIRETKFYKTRLMPIGPHLFQILHDYQETYRPRPSPALGDPLLTYRDGRPLKDGSVRLAFRRLRLSAGIQRNDGARYQPRLHDMRHSFAVNRMTAWYRQGSDVQKLLPLLSTYLGHASIAATQVYLTMTPELMTQAAARFERYASAQEGCHE
jgi:integrase/recombinase XerD